MSKKNCITTRLLVIGLVFRIILLQLPLTFLYPKISHSKAQVKIIVMDLIPKGVDASISITLSSLMRSDLSENNKYKLINDEAMENVMNIIDMGQKFDNSCKSDLCVSEIVNALAIEQLVAGSIEKSEDGFILSLRLVETEYGKKLNSSVMEIKGGEEKLIEAVEKAILNLIIIKDTEDINDTKSLTINSVSKLGEKVKTVSSPIVKKLKKKSEIDTSLSIDKEKPIITSRSIKEMGVGKDISIVVHVKDASPIQKKIIHYRIKGSKMYHEQKMDKSDNLGNYVGIIQGKGVTKSGVEYFISATDSKGNQGFLGSPIIPNYTSPSYEKVEYDDDGVRLWVLVGGAIIAFVGIFAFALLGSPDTPKQSAKPLQPEAGIGFNW